MSLENPLSTPGGADERPDLPAGKFAVADLLGEGGMARVWRCWHHERGGWYAVKILRGRYAEQDQARRRFMDEARTMLGLKHRNVIEAFEMSDGPAPYLVMEVADGGSLEDWVKRHGPMPPRLAVDAAIQICKGIGAAHKGGVIHRDVKPHNVLINRRGWCKVTDFGIARIRRPDGTSDVPDATISEGGDDAMGTLGYMAPEQQSDPRSADLRADVYGIGATLYHILTGRKPLTNLFVIEKEAPELLVDIPEQVRSIVLDATRFIPGERMPSVHDLAKVLHAAWSELPPDPPTSPALNADVPPEPPSPPGTTPRRAAPPSLAPTSGLFDEPGLAPPSLEDLPTAVTKTATPAPEPQPTSAGPRFATTAPPVELRYAAMRRASEEDRATSDVSATTRWWVVLGTTLGMLMSFIALDVSWVGAAAKNASEASRAFTARIQSDLPVIDELATLGADRPTLDGLYQSYTNSTSTEEAILSSERYVMALQEAVAQVPAEGRTTALARERVGRAARAREAWMASIDSWDQRASAFPGVIVVRIGLVADAPTRAAR